MTEKIHKKGCVIDLRVSTTKQAQQGDSLENQLEKCLRIANERGWQVKRIWSNALSGRKTERTDLFDEIIEYIKAHKGEVQYYLFRSIDRFTRGGSVPYGVMKQKLTELGVEMIDYYGIIQPMKNTLEDLGVEYEWSKSSSSEITEVVLATTFKAEITSTLTRLIGREIVLTREGYKMRWADDGLMNKVVYVEGKKRIIQVPNPDRAKFYIKMFEMRESQQYTDQEIVDEVNAMGYRTRIKNKWDKERKKIIGQTGGNILTVKKMQLDIQRPIYAGVMCEKWTKHLPIKAAYKGLVSIETFNAANRGKVFIEEDKKDGSLVILYDHYPEKMTKKRTHFNSEFPYKIILCPICKNPFLGSSPRGKSGKLHPTYHCARKHKYFGVTKKTLDDAVESFINSLEFQPEIITSMNAVFVDRYREKQADILQVASDVGKNVSELEISKATAVRSFIAATSGVVKAEVEKEINRLDEEIKNSQVQRNKLEVTEHDLEQFSQDAKNIMEHPSEILLNTTNIRQQQALFTLVFEEMPTYTEIFNGTPKLTWIFKVSSQKLDSKNIKVDLTGFEPATPSLQMRCSTK